MYRYTEGNARVRNEETGEDFPATMENRDFRRLVESGAEIAPHEPHLSALKRTAVTRLEDAVSAARTKYAPGPAHQALIYDAKLSEAQAYIANGRPADASPYILLAASAQGAGRSVSDEADAVMQRGVAWLQIGAATERLRIAGNAAIAQAQTVSEIEAARDAHVAQLAAL